MFCRAVKTGTINGSCVVPTRKPVTITSDNVKLARELFGRFIRQKLDPELCGAASFVPVPSKDSWNTSQFRSLTMLKEALPLRQHQIKSLVKFGVERPRATEGGERGYEAIKPYLMPTTEAIPSGPIVLIDDIVTTGGSILAVRDFLTELGANVACAVVCGKTTTAVEPAFQMREVELDDRIGDVDF